MVTYSAYTSVVSTTTFQAELGAYMTGLTTPLSSAQLTRLNAFIVSLKASLSIASLSDVFDVMYILAGETEESSLKNLVKNAHHCTNVHATVWTQYEGFTGDGAADYLDTDYNPNTQGKNYVQNSASYGVYLRTNADDTGYNAGVRHAAGDSYLLVRLGSTQKFYIRINTLTNQDVTATSSQGLFMGNRSGANDFQMYINKAKTDKTQASTAVPNNKFFILCYCAAAGTPSGYISRQLSFFFVGKSLTELQQNAFYDAFQAYMTSNGKQV